MRQRDYSDLQELKEQVKDNLSFAAYQAYINGLEYHLEESRMLNTRLRDGMEAVMCAYDLANKEIEKTKSMKVAVDVSKDEFAARYVLGEGYPEKYYDAIGLRKSMVFMAPEELPWPEELRSSNRPKYRLVLERVMDEDKAPIMKAGEVDWDEVGKPIDSTEVTEPAWPAIERQIREATNPLFHDFARAIIWLKKRADDERSRIILLDERIRHIKAEVNCLCGEISCKKGSVGKCDAGK